MEPIVMWGLRWLSHATGLGLVLWLLLLLPARAADSLLMRIAIVQETSQVKLGSSVEGQILDADGNLLGTIDPMESRRASVEDGTITLSGTAADRLYLRASSPDGLVYIADRWYRGSVELRPEGSGLTAINYVDLDDYVASVVGAEMGDRFPLEALKAQAVAARTYALYHRNRRLGNPFDLGDTIAWQVYNGVETATANAQQATQATSGQVVVHNSRLIDAVFHSSSGGYTANSEDVWWDARPYLRAVNDSHVSPAMPWQRHLEPDSLEEVFGEVGDVLDLEILEANEFGRAVSLRLHGTESVQDLRANQFLLEMGLPSTVFTIEPVGPANASSAADGTDAEMPATLFTLTGQGFGHGIGMSQWGASGLAAQGWSYGQILEFYYQGTNLGAISVQ
ncbi:MAG: SpoIID/LytB domain-containing protein [Cyanobacteria bacterium J06642_12]